jgi:putative endonuclease
MSTITFFHRSDWRCHPERARGTRASEGSVCGETTLRCKIAHQPAEKRCRSQAPDARPWWVVRTYYVYIMASRSRVLYTGVTNDLARRVYEHKRSLTPGFTSKYHITRLVHFEEYGDIRDAVAREKQLKGWVRARKTRLIEQKNPTWEDLADRDPSRLRRSG